MKSFLPRLLVLFLAASVLGAARQLAPKGVSWIGPWPSSSTSAEKAYQLLAKPNDPPFISLANVIEAHKNSTATFLDARSSQEFSTGRIPGARNLPFYELEKYQDEALKDLSADSEIIIYCEGIGCELSFFLGRELRDAGYTNLHIFYGGYPEWKEAKQPIET